MRSADKVVVFIIFLTLVIFPSRAEAYLDPGTGSYVLQVVAAVFFGGLFALKMFWKQITGFFTGRSRKDDSSEKSSHRNDN